MKLTTLLARMFQPSPRPAPAQRHRVRLELEGLEDRRVMSGTQMTQAALGQLAQAQVAQQQYQYRPGHYTFFVYSYKAIGGQQYCKRNERFASRQQAEKRAQALQTQGFCTRVNQVWIQPVKVLVASPTIS